MITVLGAAGQLGTAFATKAGNARLVDRRGLDLSRPDILDRLPPLDGPVVNCAAWTAVDDAEDHEEEATLVNGAAVALLAERCAEEEVPFVTFSTDYVFDGTGGSPYKETDDPSPLNAYGRSKLVGERAALRYPRSLVVRTSWVQSGTHPCFVRTMIDLAHQRDRLSVVDDQIGRPTFADDLAGAVLEALDRGITGLVHVANEGSCSWFDLAKETVRMSGAPALVEPVPSSEYPTRARRPSYSVLNTAKSSDVGMTPLPHWRDSLATAVRKIETSR